MAIYHYSIQMIKRSDGRSAIACAAYRSATKLHDDELQKTDDFTYKKGVVYTEVLLPENAPSEYADREKLWNAVQQVEKAKNAQLAREFEMGLPIELSREQQIKFARDYVIENFVKRGMAADMVIHDRDDGNPHVHVMTTTRGFKEGGQWDAKEKKDYALDENGERIPIIDPATGEQKLDSRNRKQWQRVTVQANDWNSHDNAEIWRANWATACNRALEEIGSQERVDHRSYARQGIEKEPTIHEGYQARQMEARGEVSERCEHNRQVRERNRIREWLKAEKEKIKQEANRIKEKIKEYREMRREQKEEKTGYTAIDELIRRANVRKDAEAQTRDPNRGKGRGKDDNTLTH